jgi:hypothetical protein
MTDEEKELQQQRMAFYAQKREIIAINALKGILSNPSVDTTKVEDNTSLALQYADELFRRMYVVVTEDDKTKEEAE